MFHHFMELTYLLWGIFRCFLYLLTISETLLFQIPILFRESLNYFAFLFQLYLQFLNLPFLSFVSFSIFLAIGNSPLILTFEFGIQLPVNIILNVIYVRWANERIISLKVTHHLLWLDIAQLLLSCCLILGRY